MKKTSKTKATAKAAASNIFGSVGPTLAGIGLAALNLLQNGTSGKQIGFSAAAGILGAITRIGSKE